jgi:hypothetical protein
MTRKLWILAAAALSLAAPATAQQYGPPSSGPSSSILFVPGTLELVSGLNGLGYAGNGVAANSSTVQFNFVSGVAYDTNGNLFVADAENFVVREIVKSTGNIVLFAGTPQTEGFSANGGTALGAEFGTLSGLIVDSGNNIYVSDGTNGVVWKITSAGAISIYAGGGSSPGTCAGSTNSIGDGCLATAATLSYPAGLAFDGSGNVYVSDSHNFLVREVSITTGKISTFVGNVGDSYGSGCPAALYTTSTGPWTPTQAHLCFPYGLGFDSSGNFYVAESQRNLVRIVTKSTGDISTFAGGGTSPSTCTGSIDNFGDGCLATNATLSYPEGLYVAPDNDVYFADQGSSEIREVNASGTISIVLGGNGELVKNSIGEPDTEEVFINSSPVGAANGIFYFTMDPSGDIIATDADSGAVTSAGSSGGYVFPETAIYTTSTTTSAHTFSSLFPPYILITNPSGVTLNLGASPMITGPFGIAGGTCAFPGTVAPGASCTVVASFTPTTGNNAVSTGTIAIATNVANTPNLINLYGLGSGSPTPGATLTPNPVPAFTSPAGVTSAAQDVTVTNNGTVPLIVNTTDFDFASAAYFGNAGTTCPTSPATLGVGDTCYFQITFTPAAATGYAAGFQVDIEYYNTSNVLTNYGLISTSLSGTGTPNTLTATLTPTPLAFGGVVLGQTSVPLVATLTNNSSTASLTSVTPTITGTNQGDFAIGTGTNACGATLAASASCFIYVTFTPASATSFSATLSVADNAGNTPQTASLTGTGVSFVSNVGTAEAAQSVTVPIATAGTPSSIQVLTQGVTGLDFTLGSGGTCSTATTYTVGQTCTVNVIFKPLYPGRRLGSVQLSSSGGVTLATVPVVGLGQGPMINFGIVTSPGHYTPSSSTQFNFQAGANVAVDPKHNLYVTAGNEILEASASSNYQTTTTVATANSPQGIALDGAGDLIWTDYGSGRILEVQAVNGVIPANPTPIALGSGWSVPWSSIIDGQGDVFVSDSGLGGIYEIVAVNGVVSASSTVKLVEKTYAGLWTAFDSNGNLFFTSAYQNACIEEIPAVGGQILSSTPIQQVYCSFSLPLTIAFDAAGNLWEADFYSGVSKVEAVNGVIPSTPTVIDFNTYTFGLGLDENGNVFWTTYIGGNYNTLSEYDFSDPPSFTWSGSTNVGSTNSTAYTAFATDAGNASLTFPLSTDPAYPTDFPENSSGTGLCAAASPLTEGGICNVSVNFKPTVGGSPLSEDVVLTDNNLNASGATQSIAVIGTATGAALTAQTINFTQPATPVAYSAGLSIQLVATGGASGNAVVFTIDGSSTGAGSISGSTLTVTGVGSFVIDANQAGNSTYSAAAQVQRTVVVTQAAQTINFTQPTSPVTYSSGLQITLVATGGASGSPVVFTLDGSSTASGSISGSTLTITSTGNIVIDANQAGNANYSAATQVQRTVVSNTLLAQAINFTQPATPVTYASGLTISLVATGGASGNPVVFTLDGSSTGAGSISGSTLTATSVGSFVIDANQAGNSTYSAAPQVQRTVAVSQAGQVINFTQPTTPLTYSSGLTVSLSATGGASGSPVVFSIDGSSTATGSISGSTVTVTSTGNLVIDANQAGNADYSAAAQVQRSVTVNAPAPDFSVAATPPSQTVQPGASATYPIVVADVGSSFTGVVTLSVSGLPTGATAAFSPPTVTPGATSGSSTLTVTIPAIASVTRPNFWPMTTPVLAVLFMLPFRRWRKAWRGKLLLLIAGLASLACASSLSGCGGGFGFNQSQTYTLTVTATSGTDTHSTTVQLTVQ